MRTECPKCYSPNASYVKDGHDLLLRCLCGYFKVVFTTLGTATVVNRDHGVDVKLPRFGSNLYKTLACVSILDYPNSAEVTQRLQELGVDHNVSDVSSYLTILRGKGLVEPTVIRRGVAGGSTWILTEIAAQLLAV